MPALSCYRLQHYPQINRNLSSRSQGEIFVRKTGWGNRPSRHKILPPLGQEFLAALEMTSNGLVPRQALRLCLIHRTAISICVHFRLKKPARRFLGMSTGPGLDVMGLQPPTGPIGSSSGAWVSTVRRASGPCRRNASATAQARVGAWVWPSFAFSSGVMLGE